MDVLPYDACRQNILCSNLLNFRVLVAIVHKTLLEWLGQLSKINEFTLIERAVSWLCHLLCQTLLHCHSLLAMVVACGPVLVGYFLDYLFLHLGTELSVMLLLKAQQLISFPHKIHIYPWSSLFLFLYWDLIQTYIVLQPSFGIWFQIVRMHPNGCSRLFQTHGIKWLLTALLLDSQGVALLLCLFFYVAVDCSI